MGARYRTRACFKYSDEFLPPTPTGVGVLDTQTGAVTAAEIGAGYQPIVATSPGLPGRVFATDYLVHEVWLSMLDVSSGSPQWITGRRLGVVNPADVAVSPDGSRVALTGVGAAGIQTFSTTDLSPATMYRTDCSTRSVAWSVDSRHLVTMCNGEHYQIALFDRDNPDPVRTAAPAGDPERTPVQRGMTLAADASRVMIGTQATWESARYVDWIGLRPSAASVTVHRRAAQQRNLVVPSALPRQRGLRVDQR